MDILNTLVRTKRIKSGNQQTYRRVRLTGTPSALHILDKCGVEVKPISTKHMLCGTQREVRVTDLTTRLQSGMSRPSSATEVANWER